MYQKAGSSVRKVLGIDPHLTIGFISHGFSVHCRFTFSQLSTHPPLCLLQRDKNENKGRKKNLRVLKFKPTQQRRRASA